VGILLLFLTLGEIKPFFPKVGKKIRMSTIISSFQFSIVLANTKDKKTK
jgi:hypothetical protein